MAIGDDRLSTFKAAVAEHDDQTILDRFYYNQPAVMLAANKEPLLRRKIAQKFGISMRDVIVTGSAKLGFTTVAKQGRPIFSPFGDRSDIDIAIVATTLLEALAKIVRVRRGTGRLARCKRLQKISAQGMD